MSAAQVLARYSADAARFAGGHEAYRQLQPARRAELEARAIREWGPAIVDHVTALRLAVVMQPRPIERPVIRPAAIAGDQGLAGELARPTVADVCTCLEWTAGLHLAILSLEPPSLLANDFSQPFGHVPPLRPQTGDARTTPLPNLLPHARDPRPVPAQHRLRPQGRGRGNQPARRPGAAARSAAGRGEAGDAGRARPAGPRLVPGRRPARRSGVRLRVARSCRRQQLRPAAGGADPRCGGRMLGLSRKPAG
jgi:hypothetical protein